MFKRPSLETRSAAVEDYRSGMASTAVGEKYGYSHVAVLRWARKAGVVIRPQTDPQWHPLNQRVFAEPSPERNYWLGFIIGDGNIISRDHGGPSDRLQIPAAERDAEHIESLRRFLGTSSPVRRVWHKPVNGYTGKWAVHLCVCSRVLVTDLLQLGVEPRKSHTARVPLDLTRCPHLWRGLVDADGCLTWDKRPDRKTSCPYLSLCGSLPTCEAFAAYVNDITGGSYCPRPNGSIWQVVTGGQSAVLVAKTIYGSYTPALPRKAEIADEFNSYKPTLRKDWSSMTREDILDSFARLGSWQLVAAELGVSYSGLMSQKTRLTRRPRP